MADLFRYPSDMNHRAKRLTAWVRRNLLGTTASVRQRLGHATFAVLSGILTVVVGIFLLFEEWGWEPLRRATLALSRLQPIAALERAIVQLPPYAALVVFAVPIILLIPVKLGALYLLALGQHVLAIGLLIAAKLVGTGLAARLYQLTQPQLMRIPWFAHAYALFAPWKEAAYARVRASRAWRWGRVVKYLATQRIARIWTALKVRC